MNKIYKGQVNQLRLQFINQIKLTFINAEGEDTDIEFTHLFHIWQPETNTYCDEPVQVLYIIKGLKFVSGQCYLTGESADFAEFDDLELEEVWDLYELAHILDALTAGQYKILTNG